MTQQVQVALQTQHLSNYPHRWIPLSTLLASHLRQFSSLAKAAAACQEATGAALSVNTLSRVSRGYEPDLFTFGVLWQWMGVRIEGVRVVEVRTTEEVYSSEVKP